MELDVDAKLKIAKLGNESMVGTSGLIRTIYEYRDSVAGCEYSKEWKNGARSVCTSIIKLLKEVEEAL